MSKKNLSSAAADITKGMFTAASEPNKETNTINNTQNAVENAATSEVEAKQEKKYIRLDITGLDDYIYTLARFKGLSATKYIRSLIEKDMEENKLVYEKINALKNI